VFIAPMASGTPHYMLAMAIIRNVTDIVENACHRRSFAMTRSDVFRRRRQVPCKLYCVPILTCNVRFVTTRWTATTDPTRLIVITDHDAVPIRIVVTVSFYSIGEFNHQIFRLL
jgi:hypothetical protein